MVFGGIAEKMTGIIELISGQTTITETNIEDTLKEVKGILIDADVNLQVTNTLIAKVVFTNFSKIFVIDILNIELKVKDKAVGMKVEAGKNPGEQFVSLLAAELVDVMGQKQEALIKRTDGRPTSILLLGLQVFLSYILTTRGW